MLRSRSIALLVQEDRDARFASARWLAQAGYRCLMAEDAAAGFRSIRYSTPSVVVVEGNLAGSSDLIHYLEEQSDRPAIIVLSAAAVQKRREVCAGAACVHIEPPSSADALLAAVQCALAWQADARARDTEAREELDLHVQLRQAALRELVGEAPTAVAASEALQRAFASPPPLFAHARRVARLAGEMAEAMHLTDEAVAAVENAALLHDIGKLALPEASLAGDSPVGDIEMEALLDYPARTLELLDASPALAGLRHLIQRSQAWWDDRGREAQPDGGDIPVAARIIAVADAIDTLRSWDGRHAKDSSHLHAALRRLAGTRLDPEVVRVGLETLESGSCS
jgi:response regulator RpfG family c-di-GMP phosphodiesterase